jgi:DNA-binding MarR family transcriptional regulator
LHIEATAFLYEIINAADRLREARAFDGSSPFRFDRQHDLLETIERCGGAPTFSDLGRRLRISRQAARKLALAAENRGLVELFTVHDDRRAIQAALTAAGRRALDSARMPQFAWLFTLLGGLEPRAMREAGHVLRVIRRRLERDARERRARSAR